MKIANFSSIDDIDAGQWNALVRDRYPFLQHGFLSAMERHGCVGAHAGWIPRHLGCFDGDTLVGAMPLYEKHNSWGEFVFDHAWASAYQSAGIEYYPKLVNAIPFTPASGQRVLSRTVDSEEVVRHLLQGARALMEQGGFSGVHSLFVDAEEFELLNRGDAVSRSDCQFHWHNRGYANFEEFLATLKAKKRKNIRQEKARVAQSGAIIRRLDGHTATPADWRDFSAMYRGIYRRKYGYPAFNEDFFIEVAALMPDQIQLVMVQSKDDRGAGGEGGAGGAGDEGIAGALMYVDEHTLYGRHWGCRGYLDCLHFEVCYYQGIEICIERGLQRFDPGAQGEHKIARGFTPTRTRSLHWMAHSPFSRAIRQFAGAERSGIQAYINAVRQHSPYHQNDAGQ